MTFGIDNLAVMYLYYQEESRFVNYKIYSIIRNPVYASALIIGFGGFLFRFSVYAAIVFGLIYLGIIIHIHLVEDRELVERFGDSFRDYQKKVPPLFIPPKNWRKLILILFGKWK